MMSKIIMMSKCSKKGLNPFWFQLAYHTILSLVGYLCLKSSNPRNGHSKPKDIDVFFTSVSAATVSSMSTVEMEAFSNAQLVIITLLMLFGGEIFFSLVSFPFLLGIVENQNQNQNQKHNYSQKINNIQESDISSLLKIYFTGIKWLGYVVLAYLILFHLAGYGIVFVYMSIVPSAEKVLRSKGIPLHIFSIFTTVSTFANCGFVPTNENMTVFNKNSGLLLLLIPQVLMGNTLYPATLRLMIWVLEKVTKRVEFKYVLHNYDQMGYSHLLSPIQTMFLSLSVVGFILVEFVVFCCLEWNSVGLYGLNRYQKMVASLFQVVNARHAGESIVDLSMLSPAILVFFTIMMFLPPYTLYFPTKYNSTDIPEQKRKSCILENVVLSQLSYLAIFIILICITEAQKMKEDPLNFSVLNITLEVISAYGNVGFSSGYSCKRRLDQSGYCEDKWYGLAGRWSNPGKVLLIIVMLFGRLKSFNLNGGRAWKLS